MGNEFIYADTITPQKIDSPVLTSKIRVHLSSCSSGKWDFQSQ